MIGQILTELWWLKHKSERKDITNELFLQELGHDIIYLNVEFSTVFISDVKSTGCYLK